MQLELLRQYCLAKPAVTECLPFDDDTLVFKVLGKMFCLASIKEANSCNLKCEPEKAVQLRETYEGIKPGYHMDKNHWNTVYFNSDVPSSEILNLVNHSYNLVLQKCTKKAKIEAGLIV